MTDTLNQIREALDHAKHQMFNNDWDDVQEAYTSESASYRKVCAALDAVNLLIEAPKLNNEPREIRLNASEMKNHVYRMIRDANGQSSNVLASLIVDYCIDAMPMRE